MAEKMWKEIPGTDGKYLISTDGQGYGIGVEGWTGSDDTTNKGKVRKNGLTAYHISQTKSISTTRIAVFGSSANARIGKNITYIWYAIKF